MTNALGKLYRNARPLYRASLLALAVTNLLGCSGAPGDHAAEKTEQAITIPITSSWKNLGPAPENLNAYGVGSVSGRPAALAISTSFDGNGTPALFAGIAGGGVWRAVIPSYSPAWSPLTDDLSAVASASLDKESGLNNIGALAVDYWNPRVIYAGSGSNVSAYGRGLLKSRDGGSTWSFLGPLAHDNSPGFARILVDPTGPQESCSTPPCAGLQLYAAGDLGPNGGGPGIYMSITGGASWRNINADLPAPVLVTDIDYVVKGGSLTLYAGVLATGGTDPSLSGIYSTSYPFTHWTPMTISPITDFQGNPQTTSGFGGTILLAADHTINASKGVFALIGHYFPNWGILNVFSLNQSTGTWAPAAQGLSCTCPTCQARCAPGSTSTPFVNILSAASIGIDPGDGSVYVGAVNDTRQNGIFRLASGGTNWTSIDVGPNGVRPHTDHHAWAFYSGAVYDGNDGGTYRFDPGSGNWTNLNTPSVSTILAESASCHPTNPGVVLVSSQDNEVALRLNQSWNEVAGDPGEGAFVRFDPFNGAYAYATNNGGFYQSTNGGQTFSPTGVANGNASIAFHPTTPGRLATTARYGSNDTFTSIVWESYTNGASLQWYNRGGSGLPQVDATALAYGGGETIHAAYGGRLFRTVNDGGNWTEPNPGLSFMGNIVGIAGDGRENANRVYLTTDLGHIWRSGDGGTSWTDITYDFPFPGVQPPVGITPHGIDIRSETATSEPQVFVSSSLGAWAGQPTVLDGDFELGGLAPWGKSGTAQAASASTSSHTGTYAAMLGSTNPTNGTSSISQTFTVPINNATLSFWYNVHCPDSVFFDWATATLTDNTTGAVTTVLQKTCNNNQTWVNVTYALGSIAGHSVTLTLTNNDDDFAGDPTFTLFDDVAILDPATSASTWHWTRMGTGLPDTNVTDIQYNPTTRVAYVAEYGRGVFANYLSFVSDTGPGSLAVNNTSYVFGKALDGRIVGNQANYGSSFAGWFELQGGGRVGAAIGAAALNNVLFAFGRGTDSNVYVNQASVGGAWSGWSGVWGLTTDQAPAAAASTAQNQIWTFAKGANDKYIYQNHATYGQAFGAWTQIPSGWQTNSGVGAAILPSRDYAFVFMRGLDNNVYVNQASVGGNWAGWVAVPGGQTTDAAPAACADNNNIYVFVKGTDGRVMENHAAYGAGFDGWGAVAGGLLSDAAPSCTILQNGALFLFAKSTSDGRIYKNQGPTFGSWFEVGGGI